MAARGAASHHDALGIDIVLLGVVLKPIRSVQHIRNGGRRSGGFRQTVLHIADHETFFDIPQAVRFNLLLFSAVHPAAAVDHDHSGPLLFRGDLGLKNVEHGFRVMVIGNVGLNRD